MTFKPGQRKSSSGRKGIIPERQIWTRIEIENAMTLYEDDHSFEEIAHILGRSVEATKYRIHAEQAKARIAAGVTRSSISPEQEDEPARRLEGYGARDITASLFGDPPRGFSALDKQGGVS